MKDCFGMVGKMYSKKIYILDKGMFNFDFEGVKGLILPCVCVHASNIDVCL